MRQQLRRLASASLIALAFVSVPAGLAYAKTHQSRAACVSQGYYWHDTFGCQDQTCEHNGKHYWHGEGYAVGATLYVCNGFTGNFIRFRTAQPQGPQTPRAPTTGTYAPQSQAPSYPMVPGVTGTFSQP